MHKRLIFVEGRIGGFLLRVKEKEITNICGVRLDYSVSFSEWKDPYVKTFRPTNTLLAFV